MRRFDNLAVARHIAKIWGETYRKDGDYWLVMSWGEYRAWKKQKNKDGLTATRGKGLAGRRENWYNKAKHRKGTRQWRPKHNLMQ